MRSCELIHGKLIHFLQKQAKPLNFVEQFPAFFRGCSHEMYEADIHYCHNCGSFQNGPPECAAKLDKAQSNSRDTRNDPRGEEDCPAENLTIKFIVGCSVQVA